MPILFPDGKGAPNGWQWAQDAYAELQRWGRRAGEPVYKWQLVYPSRMDNLRGRQWRLYFSEKGKDVDIYIGWDGHSVHKHIHELIPRFQALASKRNSQLATERIINEKLVKEGVVEDPIYHHHFAMTLRNTWVQATSRITTREQLMRFKRDHPRLMELLNKQAGILDMTMLEYLTKHPHSKRWPHPPKTKKQYEERQQYLRGERK